MLKWWKKKSHFDRFNLGTLLWGACAAMVGITLDNLYLTVYGAVLVGGVAVLTGYFSAIARDVEDRLAKTEEDRKRGVSESQADRGTPGVF